MPNVDARTLDDSLRRLSMLAGGDLGTAVDEAVHAAVAVFRVSSSGLMIADQQGALHYFAASDGAGRDLEEAQSTAGDGPCVEAFVTNRLVQADDLRADHRWPSVHGSFLGHHVLAVLGVPVRLGGVPVGTLDLFRTEPHGWDDSERSALARYSDVIGATLTAALAAHRAGELAGQLQYALDYRIVIERAVGYLMAQRGVDAVRAFDVLRRTARDQRRKVAEVAQYLLDTGSFPATRR